MRDNYYEFDSTNPDTWEVKEQPSRPEWFDAELVSIAGLNRHGQPNLKLVWGGTEKSDRTENPRLKYHAGWSKEEITGWKYRQGDEWVFTEDIDDLDPSIMVLPDTKQEQLGHPRWIIEKWVSPEELEKQHRFRTRKGFDETEKVLREFPREGVYDAYFIVENLDSKFRQVDSDVAHFLKKKWHFESKFEENEKLIEEYDAKELEQMQKHEDELWYAAKGFDLKLPIEEREQRDEYWAKHHDYVAEYRNMIAQS